MSRKDKYIDGLDMEQFKHIPEISHYNHNYYVGFDKDLLFSECDEFYGTSTWSLLIGDTFRYIGYTYEGRGENNLHTEPNT